MHGNFSIMLISVMHRSCLSDSSVHPDSCVHPCLIAGFANNGVCAKFCGTLLRRRAAAQRSCDIAQLCINLLAPRTSSTHGKKQKREIYTSIARAACTRSPLSLAVLGRDGQDVRTTLQLHINAMSGRWRVSRQNAMLRAFPEYAAMGYSLLHCLVMASVQAEHLQDIQPTLVLAHIEGFTGKHLLTQAFIQGYIPAVAPVIKYIAAHIVASHIGLCTWCLAARNLLLSANFWMAMVCVFWIWVGRQQTGRQQCIIGDVSKPAIKEANTCKDNCVLLMLLLCNTDRFYVVAQLVSSIVASDCDCNTALFDIDSSIVSSDHGCFDPSVSTKPLQLMGTSPWLSSMHLKLSAQERSTRPKFTTSNARGQVCGITHALSESEHYSRYIGLQFVSCSEGCSVAHV